MTLVVAFRRFAGERMIRSWIKLTTYVTLILLRSIHEVSDRIEIYNALIWRGSPDMADFRPDKYVVYTIDSSQLEGMLSVVPLERMLEQSRDIISILVEQYKTETRRVPTGLMLDLYVETKNVGLDFRIVTYPLPTVSKIALYNVYKKRRIKPPQLVVDVYTIVETEKGKIKIESFYDLLRIEELGPYIRNLLVRYLLEYLLKNTMKLATNVGVRTFRLLHLLDYLDLAKSIETYRSPLRAILIYRNKFVRGLFLDLHRDLKELYSHNKDIRDVLRVIRSSLIVAAFRRRREVLMKFLEELLRHYEVYLIHDVKRKGVYVEVRNVKQFEKLVKQDLPCVLVPLAASAPTESHEKFMNSLKDVLLNALARLRSEGLDILHRMKLRALGWEALTEAMSYILTQEITKLHSR